MTDRPSPVIPAQAGTQGYAPCQGYELGDIVRAEGALHRCIAVKRGDGPVVTELHSIKKHRKGRGRKRWFKRLHLYFRQRGLCHWYKAPMSIYPLRAGEDVPVHYATFEHLDTKPSGQRGQNDTGDRRILLAHRGCNEERGGGFEWESVDCSTPDAGDDHG